MTRKRKKLFFICLVLTVMLTGPLWVQAAGEEVSEEPAVNRLIRLDLASTKRIEGEELKTRPILREFYAELEYKPLWSRDGRIYPQAKKMAEAINNVEQEGLKPENYHAAAIDLILDQKADEKGRLADNDIADLDLLLSDAFFTIACHFSHGMVNPYRMDVRWCAPVESAQLKEALQLAVKHNKVEKTLKDFLPKDKEYAALRDALAQYKKMLTTEVWPVIPKLPPKKKLKVGDIDERIPIIRERLSVTRKKHYNEDIPEASLYDEDLEKAIISFQKDNGLLDDGVIGWRTVEALNVSIEEHIDQIKINLDRMRAWSAIMEDQKKRVVVNIPAFYLTAFDENEPVLDMRVIVGMWKRKTPLLSSRIKHLIFSPKWFMPDTILFEDKLPKIKKDPSFLRRQGMKVYMKGGGEVDPESIDWEEINSKQDIPYRVVQASGNLNALGKVKFIFPNRHDVYLHDTPGKSLFNNASRTFSSGCIRIAEPVELARLLLNDKPEWTEEKITAAMNRGYEQLEPLTEPVPVHITYVTAWVNREGTVQFRRDVYGFDRAYEKVMGL